MTEISVAIMAHRSRTQWVGDVCERLDAPAEVVWDHHSDVWETGKRALLAHNPSATHHMILQDDTLPCRDLVAGAAKMLDWVPENSPMCLYFGSRGPNNAYSKLAREAREQGIHWIVLKASPMWGIGLVIPVHHISDLITFGDRTRIGPGAIYDGRIRRWYRQNAIKQWYPVPSPVEHRGPKENEPSLLNHGTGIGRTAFDFLGEDQSALDVDWCTSHLTGT